MTSKITLTSYSYDEKGRYREFLIQNNYLLDSYSVLELIYDYLHNNPNFNTFGNKKIMMVHAIFDDVEYSLHHNILIDSNTTFQDYWDKVKDIINSHYDEGYEVDGIPLFRIRVWNADLLSNANIKINKDSRLFGNGFQIRGFHTIGFQQIRGFKSLRVLPTSNNIKPLNNKKVRGNSFYTLDIETVNVNGFQTPVAISFHGYKINKLFIIRSNININSQVDNLFSKFFSFIINLEGNNNNSTIFIHNLGSFDGIFLYKYLSKMFNPDQINSIIDDKNNFILINLKLKNINITFKDSLRIFPVSLNELCKIFNVRGKTSEYKIEYNSLDLFKNSDKLTKFKSYARQDSKCLYESLLIAQEKYINKYGVDITSIVSLPSLALKIFRLNYLKVNIPILSKGHDNFIRRSYFGGATDIYQCYGENLYYYDVNSLYPLPMSKPMPLKLIKSYNSIKSEGINLYNFFGFLEVDIECPEDLLRPVLPYRYKGRTIFPRGVFTGVYFSEELKTVLSLGYKIIKIHNAKEFDKASIFNEYVQDMYREKANSTGSQRWISKLLLNSLYGIFGRKQDLIESVTILKSDIPKYVCTNIIKSIIDIDEDKCTLLIIKNLDPQLIKELNINFSINISQYNNLIKSNVAIASAITSIARIHMTPYKSHPNTLYTDTDSIFTTQPLPSHLIGKELGFMKDELNGLRIKQAYFLGIKQYGYWYLDKDNNRIQKSVWAGVSRDTLTFADIVNLYNKNILTKTIDSRFFKSLIKLNIIIKSIKINIRFNPHKQLLDNNYQAITIHK